MVLNHVVFLKSNCWNRCGEKLKWNSCTCPWFLISYIKLLTAALMKYYIIKFKLISWYNILYIITGLIFDVVQTRLNGHELVTSEIHYCYSSIISSAYKFNLITREFQMRPREVRFFFRLEGRDFWLGI